MNDRYLFKAIDTNSVWRTGLLIALKGNRCAIEESDGSKWACDAKTLCQCTGLKDKNGKLIWENDIVVCRDFTEEKYVIAWKQDEACFEYQQYGCSIMNFEQLSGCEIEVIGNIFDNPELLESEEN